MEVKFPGKKAEKLIHFNENFRNYRTKLNVRNVQRFCIYFFFVSHPVRPYIRGCGMAGLLREAVSQADAAAAKYINPCCGGLTRVGIAWGRLSSNPSSLPLYHPLPHSPPLLPQRPLKVRGTRRRGSHKTRATTTPFGNISTADCICVRQQSRSE